MNLNTYLKMSTKIAVYGDFEKTREKMTRGQ